MLQTFISRISGAAEQGTRQRRRISLNPRAWAAARGRWPRGQAAAAGVGLRGRRPGLPAPPRRALGDLAGAAAPLPPVSSLLPWVIGLRRSCGGPGSFPKLGRMLGSLPDSRCSTPALQLGSPRRPARLGTRLGAGARCLPPSTVARGKQEPWPSALRRADASLRSRAELQE